jgi:hypothetical protein
VEPMTLPCVLTQHTVTVKTEYEIA